MLNSLLAQAVPLIFAGIGALWSELAGFLAISIEGWMAFGGFFSWIFTLWLQSAVLGVLCAALLAALLNWAVACFVLRSHADPFITGLALNLGISGAIPAVSSYFFGSNGVLRAESSMTINAASTQLFFAGAALLTSIVSAFVLRRTPFGLRLIAAGQSREASLERGLDPDRLCRLSWAIVAFFAALAGAALTFRIGAWTPDGVAGRGWLALAAVFLAFRRIRGIVAAAFLFALIEKACIDAQKYDFIPAEALLGIPNLLAFVLYALSQLFLRRKTYRN